MASALEYRKLLRALRLAEIPEGYRAALGMAGNLILALLGLALWPILG